MTITNIATGVLGDTAPNRDKPTPTHIDGIADTGDGEFAVTFTLWVDAANAEQAADRAMQMRQEFVDGAKEDGFHWHLHDHDGC